MKNYKIFPVLILAIALFSCGGQADYTGSTTSAKEIPVFTGHESIKHYESAHKKSDFLNQKNVAFDLELIFGGKERFNGQIELATTSGYGKMTGIDGHTVSFNQQDVTWSDTSRSEMSARFAAYTWPYFFLFPYKLSDSGTHWEDTELGFAHLGQAQKLTFDPGIGDAPDDWYITTPNDQGLIYEAAYIVTAGGTVEEAEKDPHSIQYSDYRLVNGIPIAHRWEFYAWDKIEGSTELLGEATLRNVKFSD